MWKFLKVDISDVVSSVERSSFSETELETITNLIVEMKGLIRPAILKRAGFENGYERFKIIHGDLEYHASVLAKQKNPDLEMINAFVVDPESEDIAIRQLQALSETIFEPVSSERIKEENDRNIEEKFREFATTIKQEVKSLQENYQRDIQNLRDEYQEALRAIEKKIANITPPPPPPPQKLTMLEILNIYSEPQLISMGFSKSIAQKIILERSKKPLESFRECL